MFDSRSVDVLKLCQLVLSLLYALPDASRRSAHQHADQLVLKRSSSRVQLAKEAVSSAQTTSSLGLLKIGEGLSVRRWRLADSNQIRLLIERALEYQQHVAIKMIMRFWRKYFLRTRALSGMSSDTKKERKRGMPSNELEHKYKTWAIRD